MHNDIAPPPDSIIRFFNYQTKQTEYLELGYRRGPMTYPRRYAAVTPGSKSDPLTFSELNPSETKGHLYIAFLGLSPGFLYYLWNPYDVKVLKLDEDINDIDEDLVAIDPKDFPYDDPRFPVVLMHDRYPALEAKNISGETKNPAVMWKVYQYTYKQVKQERELFNLRAGATPSLSMDTGGEM